jgi:hypothetical protein
VLPLPNCRHLQGGGRPRPDRRTQIPLQGGVLAIDY